ncbi:MAG: hypothetical protein M1813_007878 [Trichoglossum hirsutum]|nr:MAG: hypothetical protein M1813_007878 [Trichoglossum hirsutum]
MAKQPDITLYTTQTPNGIKISIALEELELPYKVHTVTLSKAEQKQPWFLAINPNGRIPALTDSFPDGQPIHLFESGSILQYLVDQYDPDHKISYPRGSREEYEVNNWLFFQNAGLGPMQGQANHFSRYAPEKIPYGISRYQNEAKRLYGVLDKHLAESKSGYLLTPDPSKVADITHWGWVASAGWAGIELSEFPALKAWLERMLARPGVEKGRHVPFAHKIADTVVNDEQANKDAAETRKWVMEGMKADAKQ